MKDVRFGIIGWGYWGPKIGRNLNTLPHAMLAMVADQDAHHLASLAANQPWIQATTQVEDIFRSDIDAIVIATPVRTHFQLAREALLHDKHVLVEKPLTTSGSLVKCNGNVRC
jgi:predicted dehydrogenase